LSKYRREDIVAMVSILEDKDRHGILEEISEFSNEVIFTSLEDFHRGTSGNELLDLVSSFKDQRVEDDLIKAFDLAKKTKKVIVVCGSFYLLSKFKRSIQKR